MVSRKVKVLFLLARLNLGGSEKMALAIAEHLSKSERFEVEICCLRNRGPMAGDFERLGLRVRSLGMDSEQAAHGTSESFLNARAVADSPSRIFSLFRYIQEGQFQIIHTQTFPDSIISRTIGRLAKVPVVINHQQNVHSHHDWKRVMLNRATVKYTDRIIAVCESVRQHAIEHDGLPPEKIDVIYNGIDPSEFESPLDPVEKKKQLGIDTEATILGMVGRIDPIKGLNYLIYSVECLVSSGFNIQVAIVGDGPSRLDLERRVRKSDLCSRVLFLGHRTDIAEILETVDIFVLPSLAEGLPISILEAMAASKPVVASDADGNPEAVKDQETGLIVPRKDPLALTKALRFLIENRDEAKRMGKAGRERVERLFTKQNLVTGVECLYERLLGS